MKTETGSATKPKSAAKPKTGKSIKPVTKPAGVSKAKKAKAPASPPAPVDLTESVEQQNAAILANDAAETDSYQSMTIATETEPPTAEQIAEADEHDQEQELATEAASTSGAPANPADSPRPPQRGRATPGAVLWTHARNVGLVRALKQATDPKKKKPVMSRVIEILHGDPVFAGCTFTPRKITTQLSLLRNTYPDIGLPVRFVRIETAPRARRTTIEYSPEAEVELAEVYHDDDGDGEVTEVIGQPAAEVQTTGA